ncbi:uncharacterized protein LOC118909543 isoform X1 [Manis pentadactyla]|nr:uncharacterized protein LOC118909543 isoform X1 [Manis pentadactyla]
MLMDPRRCSAAPSSRRACGGGTDLVPGLGSPPRARWAPGAAFAFLGSPAAGGGLRSTRTWSRCPGRTSESSAEKRLPLSHFCSGGSRAGPTSGVKATATALRAGRYLPSPHCVSAPVLRTWNAVITKTILMLKSRTPRLGIHHRPLPVPAAHAPPAGQRHLLPVPATCPSSCAITCCREGSFLPGPARRSPVPPTHTVPAGQGLLPLMSPSLAKALHRRPEPSNSGCLPPAPGPHLARVPVPFSRRPGLAAAAHPQPPSWSPPLSCPARRCLPLTPALDACRYHRPPMPSSADADVAAFTSAHGPPLRDPSDSYHRQQGPPCQGPGSLVPLQASPPCSNLSS